MPEKMSTPVEYFDTCCVCDEEFSSDGELADHLLGHASDEDFKTSLALLEQKSAPVVGTGNVKRSFTQLSASPEVWEIISDSDDESSTNNTPKLSNSFRLVTSEKAGHNSTPQGKPGTSAGKTSSTNNNPKLANSLRVVTSENAGSNTKNQGKPSTPAENKPPYYCIICKMDLKDAKVYKEHLLQHDKKKQFFCQICNKKFAYKGTLRQHLHKHIGEKSHECQTCHKKFSLKKMLAQHEETHKVEEMRKTRMQTRNRVR